MQHNKPAGVAPGVVAASVPACDSGHGAPVDAAASQAVATTAGGATDDVTDDAPTTAVADLDALRQRRIRSYVTRAGRVSVAQQRSLDTLWPRYGVDYRAAVLDYAALFGQAVDAVRPTVFEIGFGMGETTAAIAAARRDVNFIGVEVHTPGVGALLKQIGELGLDNVRIISHDAVEVLEHMIAPASLAGVHVYFPDPWHKARHHKRRLLQPPLVKLLASRLAPGAYLHCATDWEDYAEQMLDVLSAEPLLANTVAAYAPRINPLVERPRTKFEARGLRLGHGVWDLIFRRVAAWPVRR